MWFETLVLLGLVMQVFVCVPKLKLLFKTTMSVTIGRVVHW